MEKRYLSGKNVHFISNVHFNSKPADIVLKKGQDIDCMFLSCHVRVSE